MGQTNEIFGGASVAGGLHREEGLPNQDAFLIKRYAFGVVLAAADGLGSLPLSHYGSQAACAAVGEAVRIWNRKKGAPVEVLIRLVHTLWEMNLEPHAKNECGTTCLFAVIFRSGRLLCAQLGDGLIGIRTEEGFRVVAEKDEDVFLNVTPSMHTVRSFGDWTWMDLENVSGDLSIMLATDGVSGDIIPEQRAAFLQHLLTLMSDKPGLRERNASIHRLLTEWPIQHSQDDKTLIVYRRGAIHHEVSQ